MERCIQAIEQVAVDCKARERDASEMTCMLRQVGVITRGELLNCGNKPKGAETFSMILLDRDVLVDLLRKYPPAVVWFDALHENEEVVVSGAVWSTARVNTLGHGWSTGGVRLMPTRIARKGEANEVPSL